MFKVELKTILPLYDINTNGYEIREYDKDLDDGRSVIADICDIFASTENVMFLVSGFGEENWAVDCRFDLPTIIEQLPEIIIKIKNEDFNFSLDFYEQGIEREVNFKDDVNGVSLVCTSRNDWIPDPKRIEMKKQDVSNMFNKLYEDFMSYSTILCNGLANHYLFKEWMDI